MKPAATKMTYDQYCLLPDDGNQYEVIDGELFVTPAPSPKHQEIAGELFALLKAHVKARRLGKVYIAPVDILLEEHTIVQPDILFIRQERLGIVGEKKVDAAPDLVIEVLSPSTFYKDLRKKMGAYSQYGVQEYWIVDPERQTIEVHRRGSQALQLSRSFSSQETFESTLIPGFQFRVGSIFQV